MHIETKIAPKEWWYPYAPGDQAPPSERALSALDQQHVAPLAVEAAVAQVEPHLAPAAARAPARRWPRSR